MQFLKCPHTIHWVSNMSVFSISYLWTELYLHKNSKSARSFWKLSLELYKSHLFAKGSLLILTSSSVANNGRSSAIVDRLRTIGWQKNLEITKMNDHFSQKERILELPKLEDLFFFKFYYWIPLKLSEFRYTRNVYLPYSCMNVELSWIAHSWK